MSYQLCDVIKCFYSDMYHFIHVSFRLETLIFIKNPNLLKGNTRALVCLFQTRKYKKRRKESWMIDF